MLLFRLVLYSLAGLVISSFIHELGHLIVAMIHRWKFSLLIVGPFRWQQDDFKERIVFRFERNILYWGGVSSAVPSDKDIDNLSIWARTLISGPLLSLIFAILLIPLFIFSGSFFVLLTLAESFGMGLICIIPFPIRTGLMYTDGYRFWRLMFSGKGKLEEAALFNLSVQHSLFGEVDLESTSLIVEPLLKSKDFSYRYYAYYYLYELARDENKTAECEKYISELKKISNKVPKNLVRQFNIS